MLWRLYIRCKFSTFQEKFAFLRRIAWLSNIKLVTVTLHWKDWKSYGRLVSLVAPVQWMYRLVTPVGYNEWCTLQTGGYSIMNDVRYRLVTPIGYNEWCTLQTGGYSTMNDVRYRLVTSSGSSIERTRRTPPPRYWWKYWILIFLNEVKLTPLFSAKMWLTPPPLAHSGSATGDSSRLQWMMYVTDWWL